jgi:hypothetical protein
VVIGNGIVVGYQDSVGVGFDGFVAGGGCHGKSGEYDQDQKGVKF